MSGLIKGEKQLDNDRHFMFICFLTLATLALFVGEANNIALSERAARQSTTSAQTNQP